MTTRRVRLVQLAAAGAFLVLAGVASGRGSGGSGGEGPPSSSHSAAPDGLAAYPALLARFGHRSEPANGNLADARLAPTSTLVVVDARDALDAGEIEVLTRFVERGGRLVVAGNEEQWPEELVPGLVSGAARAGPAEVSPAQLNIVVPGAVEVGSARRVEGAGGGSFRTLGEAAPLMVGPSGEPVAAVARRGSGQILVLADSSVLQNRFLGRADNAALALALVGEPRRVVRFAEGPHGFDSEPPGLPSSWSVAWWTLVLAGAILALACGRRLGPVEEPERDLPPPRLAYVSALAGTLLRSGRTGESLEPIRARCLRMVASARWLPVEPDNAELRAAAAALGLSDEEVEALVRPAEGTGGALALGRALARLSVGEKHRR